MGFITGSRKNTPESLAIVRGTVANIMKQGGGIVVGVGDGADVAAIQEALAQDPAGTRLRVFLVSNLPSYKETRVKKLSLPETPTDQIPSLHELIETLDKLAVLPNTIQVSQRIPVEGEDPSVKYDQLNAEMAGYALSHSGRESAIGLYFKYESARGTNAAIDMVSDQLEGRVYNGLDPLANPYYPHE